jgi:hypothetical protein
MARGSQFGMPGWVAESEFEGGWLSYAFETGQIFEWSRWRTCSREEQS